MNKEIIYTSLQKIFIAVVLFCYNYFFEYGTGDLITSILVTLTLIGLIELIYCIIMLIYQALKYISFGKSNN